VRRNCSMTVGRKFVLRARGISRSSDPARVLRPRVRLPLRRSRRSLLRSYGADVPVELRLYGSVVDQRQHLFEHVLVLRFRVRCQELERQ